MLATLALPADDETRTFDLTMGRRPAGLQDGNDPVRLPQIGVALEHATTGVALDGEADLQVAGLIGRGGMGDVWLARQHFEGDVRVGARERRLLGSVITLGIALVATFSLRHSAQGTLDSREILVFALALFVPFALVVVLLRRRLLGNVFTRRTVAFLGLLLALILVHRAFGALLAAWNPPWLVRRWSLDARAPR